MQQKFTDFSLIKRAESSQLPKINFFAPRKEMVNVIRLNSISQVYMWCDNKLREPIAVKSATQSMSSECLPFNISFIFGNRKKSLGARCGE
jgi:hypothetical protein